MYFNVTNVFYNYMHLDFWISKYCVKKALWASQERLRTWDLQVMVSFWWCTRHGEFLYRLRCWNLPWSPRTPSAWVQWVRRPFKNSRLRKEQVAPTTSLLLHQMWLSLFHLLPGHPVDCLLSLKQQSAKEWKPCAKNQWESDVVWRRSRHSFFPLEGSLEEEPQWETPAQHFLILLHPQEPGFQLAVYRLQRSLQALHGSLRDYALEFKGSTWQMLKEVSRCWPSSRLSLFF